LPKTAENFRLLVKILVSIYSLNLLSVMYTSDLSIIFFNDFSIFSFLCVHSFFVNHKLFVFLICYTCTCIFISCLVIIIYFVKIKGCRNLIREILINFAGKLHNPTSDLKIINCLHYRLRLMLKINLDLEYIYMSCIFSIKFSLTITFSLWK
jgi:hypothetical protein